MTTPACSWPWLLRDIPLVRLREWNFEFHFRLIVGRSSVQSGIPSLVWFLVPVWVPLFKSISMSGFPSRLSCPVQSVVLLYEAKANPLYCIRSSWLCWYIKHIGILLVQCGTHICQCQSNINQVIEFIPPLLSGWGKREEFFMSL